MVHALREAHRVLKANGILVDIRPVSMHRRVGITHRGRFQHLGFMRERFDDDRAADRAIRQVLQEGLFKMQSRSQIDCRRLLDSLNDLRLWIAEFVTSSDLRPHDWLIQRAERAMGQKRVKWRIEVRGPLQLRVLGKVELAGRR